MKLVLDTLERPTSRLLVVVIGFLIAGIGLAEPDLGSIHPNIVVIAGYAISILGLMLILVAHNASIKRNNEVIEEIDRTLNRYSTLSRIERSSNSQSDIIRKTACSTLISLVDKDIPELAQAIYSFQKTGTTQLQLDDNYLAKNSPFELLKLLPPGSIWLGVSLLDQANWQSDHLRGFLDRSRSMCAGNRLHMCRIYAHDGTRPRVSKDMIDRDERAGINLKFLDLLKFKGASLPRDLTLIVKNKLGSANKLIEKLNNPKSKIDYEAIGALVFEIDRNRALSKVTLYTGGSTAFDGYFNDFRHWWSSSLIP